MRRVRKIKRRVKGRPGRPSRVLVRKKKKKKTALKLPTSKMSFKKKATLMRKLSSSKKYKMWRRAVFKRDGYQCVLCKNRKYIEAHHLLRKWDFPGLMFEVHNGMTLCGPSTNVKTCHGKVTGREYEELPLLIKQMNKLQKTWFRGILKEKGLL